MKDWREIAGSPLVIGIFLTVWFAAAIFWIVDVYRSDPDLTDRDRMDKLLDEFESEIESFGIPERTGLNRREIDFAKRGVVVSSGRRYRTELAPEVFAAYFHDRLTEKGWVLRKTEGLDGRFDRSRWYSRDKFEARVSVEGKNLFSDDGNYFVVELGLRRNSGLLEKEL